MTGKYMRGKPIGARARLGAPPAADHGTYNGMLTLCGICHSELFVEDRYFARVTERPCPGLSPKRCFTLADETRPEPVQPSAAKRQHTALLVPYAGPAAFRPLRPCTELRMTFARNGSAAIHLAPRAPNPSRPARKTHGVER